MKKQFYNILMKLIAKISQKMQILAKITHFCSKNSKISKYKNNKLFFIIHLQQLFINFEIIKVYF
jgi:hypothetical protein